jgi:hypothetical protein
MIACSHIIGPKKLNELWKEALIVQDYLAGLNLLDDDKVTGYIQGLNQAAADAAVAPVLIKLESAEEKLKDSESKRKDSESKLKDSESKLKDSEARNARLKAAFEAAGLSLDGLDS